MTLSEDRSPWDFSKSEKAITLSKVISPVRLASTYLEPSAHQFDFLFHLSCKTQGTQR